MTSAHKIKMGIVVQNEKGERTTVMVPIDKLIMDLQIRLRAVEGKLEAVIKELEAVKK